jgi:DNA-binding transcriptional regulator LsrR (DeoR family)
LAEVTEWIHVKIDLNELARLRWIKKMTTPEIATELGWGRTAVQDSVRTIRKNGISELNLTAAEKKVVRTAIKEEIAILRITQPRFKMSDISKEFRSQR